MAENTKIEWCRHTMNPWRGCSKVSPGCANCYADTLSHRNPKTLGVWGPTGTRVVAADGQWRLPAKWDREAAAAGERHRVFCASLADVLEDWQGPMRNSANDVLWRNTLDASAQWSNGHGGEAGAFSCVTMQDVRNRLFRLIDATPNLDWLLLTKRPENIARMTPPRDLGERDEGIAEGDYGYCDPERKFYYPNVWLGTSVEDQQRADERIPRLLSVPAAVRFLSCEPLLGPIEFSDVTKRSDAVEQLGKKSLAGIHWIIVGGESGPNARPCNVEWVRGIVRQCKEAGVACFVKQLGSNVVDECENCTPEYTGWPPENSPIDWDTGAVKLRDRKGGDSGEWPEDLRVREFPTTREATT